MADSGSFNADLGINMQFNIDGAGLVEMTKTIKEISKGKDLQRYWKDVEAATDSAAKAIERYNKNTQSKGLAENFLKQINALKAITNKENMTDIFPNMDINFDELIESAKKLAPKINAEFSSSNFSQAFKTFDLLKDKGIELGEVFSKLSDYSSKVDENFKLRRENNEFKDLFGEQDIDKIKKNLSEIQKLRNEAEETFNNFLSINKIEKTDYWGDEQFSEYFNGIRNGSLTATEAIAKFKTEYTYLLEKSFKSNNDTFGLDQLQAFSTKLDSIFHQVEETSNKINDIISNGVIAKSVQNLSEDPTLSDSQRSIFGNILQDEESLKSITALFQKLIDETSQTKNTEVFNTEQFAKIESLFTSIESSLSSIKGVLVDVGDGEELSPLLKQLDNIREATSNIKLSLNLDLGNEVSERLNQKVSQSTQRQLEAYRKLFSAMKGTGKTNKEMLKFFEPDEASATELIGVYQGIIKRAEEKFKVGNSNIYKKLLGSTYDDLKKEIKNANAQLGRAENKHSENGILGDLFGNSKDLSGVIEQLNTIVSKLDEISVSAKGFAETFKNGLNVNTSVEEIEKLTNRVKELESELAKIKTPTTIPSKDMKDAFHSDIDTSSSVKSLENLEEEIKKIFTDANELQNILDSLHNGKYFHLSWTTDGIDETGADERVRQLSKLLKEYGYTINNFKSDSDAFDTSGVINAIKEENNVLEQNTQKVKENTQAKEQNANVNLNKYDKRLDSYNGKVDKYQATIDRFNDGGWTSSTYLENVQAVKNAVHEYETLLNELKGKDASLVTSDDINRLDNYEKKIKDTIATVTNMSASEKGYSQLAGQKEIDKINKILRESSAMSSEAKAKIKAYKQELISGNPSASLEKIHGEIMKIVNAEELAGRAGKSFFDTLKNSGFHQIAAQMAGMFGLYDIINIGKQAIGVVTELDSAFTEMRKVSDETTQSLKNYQKTTFDTANDVGTTAMQIQNSTADWQRLGYSLDEASELAKNSNIYKNVGDMNIDEATEHMISSVQAWKSEFNDAVTASEEIMNRYNKIGNEFAISSADIGEAMETSAAALKAGGNDLNESIGLITAGNLIQQDASTTASAMKILSLRIRGAKADLDAMGESTDDLSDSTSKMREELKALTGVDIMKDENTFKSTAEIIQEMGKNWDKLTDVSKAAALEKLAGKNRASTVSGLIENYETIGKVIEAAENSENSALEENEKYLESIEGRTQKLTNQLQELASVSIKDDWIKGIISGLTNLLDLVTKLVDKIGIVPTILSGVGIFKGIKTFSKNLA